MAELLFQDLSFSEKEDSVRVTFLRLFYFEIDKNILERIAKFTINKNKILFDGISETKARNKFNMVLEQGFKNLKNKLNEKRTVYIHKNSHLPLLGHVAFGLIDRGSNLIEVKPITGCNLQCVYCSVDENKRPVDFVIEEEYLVEELRKLVEYKHYDDIEAHIASQGEPLLYAPLVELVRDLKKIPQVKRVSIDTNGIMLTKKLVDDLVDAGLTEVN